MQPPKTQFLTFTSETKIIKITHSADMYLCHNLQNFKVYLSWHKALLLNHVYADHLSL